MICYRLEPRFMRRFHFGQEGLFLERSSVTFPSDALFSALVTTAAHQQEDIPELLKPFHERTPSFRLTSAFPVIGRLPLFPFPRRPFNAKPENLPRKFAKKVMFVSGAILKRLLNYEPIDAYLPAKEGKTSKGLFIQGKKIWLTEAERPLLPSDWRDPDLTPKWLSEQTAWQTGTHPHVTLARWQQESTPFYVGQVQFHSECGLWVGVDYADPVIQNKVELWLDLLGDSGIGGKRSAGYGAYKLVKEPSWKIDGLDGMAKSDYQMLLSRTHPHPTDMDAFINGVESAYHLDDIGGRSATFRRKRVRMVAEGSVISNKVRGQLVEITPSRDIEKQLPYPIYRYGMALGLEVKV